MAVTCDIQSALSCIAYSGIAVHALTLRVASMSDINSIRSFQRAYNSLFIRNVYLCLSVYEYELAANKDKDGFHLPGLAHQSVFNDLDYSAISYVSTDHGTTQSIMSICWWLSTYVASVIIILTFAERHHIRVYQKSFRDS